MTLHLSPWFVHLRKNLFDRGSLKAATTIGTDLRSWGESWGCMQTRGWAEYFWNNWELHTWINLEMENVVTDGRSPWLISEVAWRENTVLAKHEICCLKYARLSKQNRLLNSKQWFAYVLTLFRTSLCEGWRRLQNDQREIMNGQRWLPILWDSHNLL